MKLLVALLKLGHNLQGLLHRGLGNVDLLEAAHYPLALLQIPVELLIGGRADEADMSRLKVRLEHVGAVHRALASGSGSYQLMDLVDIDYRAFLFRNAVHHAFDALLEVAAILRAGNERGEVDLENSCLLEAFRHVAGVDLGGESIHERSLADARFADMERVVLVLSAEHLHGPVKFRLASDQWVVMLQVVVDADGIVLPIHAFAEGVLHKDVGIVLNGLLQSVIAENHLLGTKSFLLAIGADELAEKFPFRPLDPHEQYVGGGRFFERHDGLHQDRHRQSLGARLLARPIGCVDDLLKHQRRVGEVFVLFEFLFGEFLHILEVVDERFGDIYNHAAHIVNRLAEGILEGQFEEQIFGGDEFMLHLPGLLVGCFDGVVYVV